jgi:hypothetical protein
MWYCRHQKVELREHGCESLRKLLIYLMTTEVTIGSEGEPFSNGQELSAARPVLVALSINPYITLSEPLN